jgi:tRNA A-37 threonylcarbamoyl transferase component Bud32
MSAANEQQPATATTSGCVPLSPGEHAPQAIQMCQLRSSELWHTFLCVAKTEVLKNTLPLTMLGSLLVFPKLLLLWVPFVLLWSGGEALYRRLGSVNKARVKRLVPSRWAESRLCRELSDAIMQVRPFILLSLYFCFAPFALVWMYVHWLSRVNKPSAKDAGANLVPAEDMISFVQNRRQHDEEEEANFFHSPAFTITSLVLFVSGLPALLTYFLYNYLGVDAVLGFPSLAPQFKTVFVMIDLYFYSVGWCASVLFFRSWFSFPLNFLGKEEEVQLDSVGVRRRIHSWFTEVVTMNSPWSGATYLEWSDVKALRLDRSNAPLYPLPQTAFPANSLVYQVLNRIAMFVDGLHKNGQREECAYFTTSEQILPNAGRLNNGSTLSINLTEMSGDDRARLYYAVRKFAPNVEIDRELQEKIMGTTVLEAPRYTQLWFDLLLDKMPVNRAGVLPPGYKLDKGGLTTIERLASGGQANVYLAHESDQTEVVVKEFILSTSDAVGALVESAGEFETEATLLSELKHDRIVKMLRFFAEDRRLYLVLEKVEGKSLRNWVKAEHGVFSEKETIEIALQVCEVLEYLHAQTPPVVHRDIAPDNLIFDENSGVKVIDFSLASAKKCRRTTSTMGKHSYAPPEQFREQPCPQSDIYALGATMYFLLTGEDPKPISISDVSAKRAGISSCLNDVIKRATAFSLDDRYSAVQWMQLDLQAALKELHERQPASC